MQDRKEAASRSSLVQKECIPAETEYCTCSSLSLVQKIPILQQEEEGNEEECVVASSVLNRRLRGILKGFFPRSTPLSVLLLHVSQREWITLDTHEPLAQRYRRAHAPASFLEQALINLRRVIRVDDQELLLQESCGAALILPEVDLEGAYEVLERIYHSISLLQAETVIPPLQRETFVLMGVSSYPEPGASLEHMLYQTGAPVQRFVLRPALSICTQQVEQVTQAQTEARGSERSCAGKEQVVIPFMRLPRELPGRLKHLIPYQVARELHCIPVGRDHHHLTVAMLNPTCQEDINRLHQITRMTIFPVACQQEDLDMLLSQEW